MNIPHPLASLATLARGGPWLPRALRAAGLAALMVVSNQAAEASQPAGSNIGQTTNSTSPTTVPGGTSTPAKPAAPRKSASSASTSR